MRGSVGDKRWGGEVYETSDKEGAVRRNEGRNSRVSVGRKSRVSVGRKIRVSEGRESSVSDGE